MLKESLTLLVVVLSMSVVVFALCAVVWGWFNYQACQVLQSLNPDQEFRFEFFVGCLFKSPTGTFMPLEQVEIRNK